MPQLPSVSELLIGAQNPAGSGSQYQPQLPRNQKSAATRVQKRLSGTSPRQKEVFLHAPHGSMNLPHALLLMHIFPATTNRQSESHTSAPHIPRAKEMHVESSITSSGRNSVLSVCLDPQAPPTTGTQMDYFSYRESQRPRHVLLHLLQLQLLLPLLHYRPRQESGVGLVTRATLYQSLGLPESRLPQDESPTFPARPRPASFSYPPGPAPGGMLPVSYNPKMVQGFHAPSQGPVPAPFPSSMTVPVYFNGATAGSGSMPTHGQPGHPGPIIGYPGYYNAITYNNQISPGAVAAYGPEFYSHGQHMFGVPHAGPHSQMEGKTMSHNIAGNLGHFLKHAMCADEMAADPNHALINKRCIIKRRTRTGCLTCRKRRIKCDERKPHCFNCERLKKLCLGYEVQSNKDSGNNENTEKEKLKESEAKGACAPQIQPRQRSSVHDLM